MKTLSQSATAPDFVQNPYPFYEAARDAGPLVFWQDYDMPAAMSLDLVSAIFKNRKFGREVPEEMAPVIPDHVKDFYAVEAHSMLELEPPRHTRLRSLVLRAFTTRSIAALEEEIDALCHELIDTFPEGPFDLLEAYCTQVPIITIARLLGVPDEMAPQFLAWSHAMVTMYTAGRTRADEEAANTAAREFIEYLTGYIDQRRQTPSDDLISRLIAAEEEGEKLSTEELITTCVLLLNAGHEATVHSMGNGVKTLLETGLQTNWLAPDAIDQTVEEILRYDPPLHMFTRYAYEDIEVAGHTFKRGDQIALMLGAANRDPAGWENPNRFDPTRKIKTNTAFGGGLHFCVGAPLARLEMKIALPILFDRCPDLSLVGTPKYANAYHFHGLERLEVTL
ncbi:unspecific monooxygenase [Shimia isoporae]|uniref:Unspecific monooxygenase n=1 Tax=Shimia isoporae TaxID=647720 RepID=A0A4R1NPK9_9RHOB|nr:cytochrome P450 [Shimia isoporae]TCL09781.1 unspecific monooxygenase [Shimia isoporae]